MYWEKFGECAGSVYEVVQETSEFTSLYGVD